MVERVAILWRGNHRVAPCRQVSAAALYQHANLVLGVEMGGVTPCGLRQEIGLTRSMTLGNLPVDDLLQIVG
jgi:hypothetical protein